MMQLQLSQKLRLTKSLVVGIHDWRHYLHLTLPSILQCTRYIDEVIFVLDRLNDVDQQKCQSLIQAYLVDTICDVHLLFKDEKKWQYRPAETFNYGFTYAQGDLLYVSAEDIVLDPTNFRNEYWFDSSVGMVDFRYYSHDPFQWNFHVAWDTTLLKLSDFLFGYGTVRSGLYGVRRTVYEDVGGLKDSPTEEDWLRKDVKALGYRHVHVKSTRNLHLRPSYDKERQLMQGISRRKQGFSLPRVIAHSILHLKPNVLRGYLSCGDTA